jgi:membrane associated rhomboid family serine protease
MMFRISPTVKNLIIINVIMFLGTWAVESYNQVDLNRVLGLYFFKSENFHVFQYISYMFMHGGFLHLFFNMYALFMFGTILEQVWGSKRFLIFYFVTGVGAALVHTLVNYIEYIPMVNDAHAFMNTPSPELFSAFIKEYVNEPNRQVFDFINQWSENPENTQFISSATEMITNHLQIVINTPTVGASGAVFGILLGFGMLFPNTELMLLFPPIPIKAKYLVLIYGGLELFLAIKQPGSQIAHFAHLGGMLFGFIMIKMWDKDRKQFY